MPNLDLVFCEQFATKHHEGQKRHNGDPYVTHPIRVAKCVIGICPDALDRFNIDPNSDRGKTFVQEAQVVALWHDLIEDTQLTEDDIAVAAGEAGADPLMRMRITDAVMFLTKIKGPSFDICRYLDCIKDRALSWAVKHADLIDNLSDLKQGTLRNSYRLAQAYLNYE